MSLRSRPTTQPSTSGVELVKVPKSTQQGQPTFSQRGISQTLTSAANLANLLPTGTLLAFQLLTPIFTNNGACDPVTRTLSFLLLLLLSFSCFLASFTDSMKASDGQRAVLFDYPDPTGSDLPDLSKFRIRFIDWVHAVLSVLVFGVVALRDKNVVGCFYPQPGHTVQEVLDIVPVGVGLVCSLLFVVFPTRRHGIGYPVTPGK
ncbi:hypothetical protein L484_018458 [Morus notabilis]|uniref:Uncharacterized protein n=1 Tax=Morus notabilis TaxID=981085 RepID=W9QYG8_9ROSA|nr:hypothetical protein L484_018458 [Morus notabilis]